MSGIAYFGPSRPAQAAVFAKKAEPQSRGHCLEGTMPKMTKYQPGTFCWADLSTTDPAGAKRYYSELLGWKFEDVPVPGAPPYSMAKVNGSEVAALSLLMPELQAKGVPAHWGAYVSVESADQAAKQAQSLGGKLAMAPFDVMDVGRMAVIEDPTGATVRVWQPKKHIGAGLVGEVGAFCWDELMTRDPDAATRFYTQLFGWKARVETYSGAPYTLFLRDAQEVAGMMAMPKEAGAAPPHWMVYFEVPDCERAVEKTNRMKGKVLVPPTEIPEMGRFAVMQDPQSAVFGVFKPLRPK